VVTNILTIISIVSSFVTAILVVTLNKRNDRTLKRIENDLKKDHLFLNRLIILRENVSKPIGNLQGDIQALAFILKKNDQKELSQFFTREFIDRNAERVGEVSLEYEKNKFLFNTDETQIIENLMGKYQDLTLENDVIGAFAEAAKFHNRFLELIDQKITLK
jgi:hypothetical protein